MSRLLAILILVLPAAAFAQEWDLLGFNPRATAMGNVQAAADGDFTAVYYNPALLHGGSLGLGYTYEQPLLHDAAVGTPYSGSPAVHPLTDVEGFTLGAAAPLGGIFHDRVTMGFGIYVPQTGLVLARMLDDGAATYYRFEDAPSQFQLAAGVGVQPFDWLSIGASAQILGNTGGSADFTAHLGEASGNGVQGTPSYIKTSDLATTDPVTIAPIVGAVVGPFWGFRLLGCWRGEASGNYTLPINVLMDQSLGDLSVDVNGTYHFSPDEFTVGLGKTLLGGRLLVAADVEYDEWSEAPPPIASIGVTLPSVLSTLYNGTINPQTAATNFVDTWTPRLGVEWKPLDSLAVRGGYFFRPTMLPSAPAAPHAKEPNQLYLDSDANVFSFGLAYGFPDPLKIARRLTVEAAVQVGLLGTRTYGQDNVNGVLAYQSSGTTVDIPVAVRYDF